MENISVIMATNRIDHYLDESVTSVFNTEGVRVELVIVLDGISLPPNKPTWVADPRIKLVHNEHSRGLGAALNIGIRAASHEIIARLDSDDNSYPARFVLQIEQLISPTNPILVGGMIELMDEHGRSLGSAKQPCGPDVRKTLLLQNVVPHSTYMFRKSDALKVGLYNESLKQMEDYDFLLKMAQRGPVSVVCQPLVRYRIHSGQMSKAAQWRANYISAVTNQRVALAKVIRVSRAEVALKNAIWRIAQISRSLGLTKPRHLIGVSQRSEHRD